MDKPLILQCSKLQLPTMRLIALPHGTFCTLLGFTQGFGCLVEEGNPGEGPPLRVCRQSLARACLDLGLLGAT